jgi:hypothetical protein
MGVVTACEITNGGGGGSSSSSTGKASADGCYRCGQQGHLARECWAIREQLRRGGLNTDLPLHQQQRLAAASPGGHAGGTAAAYEAEHLASLGPRPSPLQPAARAAWDAAAARIDRGHGSRGGGGRHRSRSRSRERERERERERDRRSGWREDDRRSSNRRSSRSRSRDRNRNRDRDRHSRHNRPRKRSRSRSRDAARRRQPADGGGGGGGGGGDSNERRRESHGGWDDIPDIRNSDPSASTAATAAAAASNNSSSHGDQQPPPPPQQTPQQPPQRSPGLDSTGSSGAQNGGNVDSSSIIGSTLDGHHAVMAVMNLARQNGWYEKRRRLFQVSFRLSGACLDK